VPHALAATVDRSRDFFDLFGDFAGYVEFCGGTPSPS
jgi:hypothetical protein